MVLLRIVNLPCILAVLASISGCDLRSSIPPLAEPMPDAVRTTTPLVNADPMAHVAAMIVDATAFVDRPGEAHGNHLFVTSGHATDEGYVADGFAASERAILLSSGYVMTHECTGTATFANGTWTIALDLVGDLAVDAHCGSWWNGTYAPAVPEAPDPSVGLSRAFHDALATLDTVEASDAPCPVAPPSGETFHVVEVDPDAPVPETIHSRDRYQALYRRTFVAPTVPEPTGGSEIDYTPGRSTGRAVLVDTETASIVCIGDVDVTSADVGGLVTTRSPHDTSRQLELQLVLELQMAANRAIAVSLHAVRADPGSAPR